jgi:4-amino-4-deoxy-L-arabinose transferase-like glycosyltransferase
VDSELSHARIIQASKPSGKPDERPLPWGLTVLGVTLLAVALKIVLLAMDAFPLNADEAVVGLMARHILQGRWPVFFYGQVYMGSLDATLVAGAFGVLGAEVITIRAVQCLLYMGTVATTMILARRGFGSRRVAIAAGLLMALPTVNTTLYSTVSLGGYGEALLLGNLLLLLSLSIRRRPEKLWRFFVWGLLAGLGFWTFGLSLVYILPTGFLILLSLRRSRKRRALFAAVVVAGALMGAGPWIWHAVVEGIGPLVAELGGSAIAVESGGSPVWGRLLNALLFGSTVTLGLRPPWGVSWLALPLAPLVLAFWVGVLIQTFSSLRSPDRNGQGRELRWLLIGVAAVLFLGFLLTPFGGDPSGRYFVPLAVPMAVLGADFVERLRLRSGRWVVYSLLAIPLFFHLWGTFQALVESPTGLTTQFDSVTWIDRDYDAQLIAFLEENDEPYGYTNYWVAYPLAFLSDEQLIFVPWLPYHQDFRYTERDDRYPPYDALVEASPQAAYITTHHPELDEYLRSAFVDLGVDWREAVIGDYRIYYALTEKINPQDIGLGVNLP